MEPAARQSWPYLLPYAALLACAELARWRPAWEAPLLALRVAAPAALLFAAWRRGGYPELSGLRLRQLPPDAALGLAVAALWLAPYLLWPALPRGEPFDPDALGARWRAAWLALRLASFVAVSPVVEELFVRSFLHRACEAWPRWTEFRARPVGRPHRLAFWVTLAWFTLSHAPWERWVALPTGALLNAWLYRRGQLGSVWIAHAVANAAIGAAVVLGPWKLWGFL
jgi:CAAX prenyl protease-like protein